MCAWAMCDLKDLATAARNCRVQIVEFTEGWAVIIAPGADSRPMMEGDREETSRGSGCRQCELNIDRWNCCRHRSRTPGVLCVQWILQAVEGTLQVARCRCAGRAGEHAKRMIVGAEQGDGTGTAGSMQSNESRSYDRGCVAGDR